MDHALRKHAKYGASSAYRWMVCPGSVALAGRAPYTPPSKWALDGTDAHELLDYALKNKYWDAREASIMAGRIAKDTHPDAGERLEAVQVALDYVADLLASYDDAVLYVEHPFQFPSAIDPDNAYGTCDICIHIPSLSLLYVIDYKHGVGKTVEVEENKQGLYYATGAVIGSGNLDADVINIVIIQPRSFHSRGRVREYAVTRERLKAFVDEVDDAILASLDPHAPLVPGDHCDWCPANLTCPAREARAVKALGANFKTVKEIVQLPDAARLPVDRLVYIKQSKRMLWQFLEDVDDALYQHAMAGNIVPGYKLVEAQARRQWFGKPEEVALKLMRLANTKDMDVIFPRTLLGITKADEIVTKAFRDAAPRGKKKQAAEDATVALAALTLKQSSGNLVLVENTDGRPAINRAAEAFGSVVALPPPSVKP